MTVWWAAIAVVLGCATCLAAMRLPVWVAVDRPPLSRAQEIGRAEWDRTPLRRHIEQLILRLAPWCSRQPLLRRISVRIAPWTRKAAWPWGLTEDEWVAGGVLAAVAAALPGLLLTGSIAGATAAMLVGFAAPFAALRESARRAQTAVLREFPDFLDLSALLVEAGLDAGSAFSRYATGKNTGVLVRHVAAFARDLRAGARLGEALEAFDAGLDESQLSPLFASLSESIRAGAALGPTLRSNAEAMRTRWFEAAERRAGEAAVRLVFPLLLLFAAVLVLIGAPLLAQFSGGLG